MLHSPLSAPPSYLVSAQSLVLLPQQEEGKVPPKNEGKLLEKWQLVQLHDMLAQYQRYQRELEAMDRALLGSHCDLPFSAVKAHLQRTLRDAAPLYTEVTLHDPLFAMFLLIGDLPEVLPSLLPLLDSIPLEETLEGALQWITGQHLAIDHRARRKRLYRESS